ncbi:MAG: hypothetical protein IJZ42_06185 [Lachnospiraceae bacterium]|nr:hypothetical protein [Lachnospiraceae bacterium]
MLETFGLAILIIIAGIIVCVIGIILCKKSEDRLKFLNTCPGENAEELEEIKSEKTYLNDKSFFAQAAIFFGGIFVIAGACMLISQTGQFDKKYTVLLDGNEVQIPCSYADIEKLGYILESDERVNFISPDDVDWIDVKNQKGQEVELIVQNQKQSDRGVRECTVIGISVAEENCPDFQLTNGVKPGMSYDRVNDIMGVGGSTTYGSNTYTEQVGSDTYNIRISYESPVISIDSDTTNNSYMDYDSLTYYAMDNFWNRKVTSISVRLDN